MASSSVPQSGERRGRKRIITKFPRLAKRVLNKLAKQSGDAEAVEMSTLMMVCLVETNGKDGDNQAIEFVTLLQSAVEVLFQVENPRSQEQAAKSIGMVAAQVDSEMCEFILKCPRVLEGLVALLTRAKHPNVQVAGVFALMHLAGGGDACQKIIALYPPTMTGVVGLFPQDRHPLTLQYGASLLFLLGLSEENRTMILQFPGALEGLVNALWKEEVPAARARAALALSILATGEDSQEKIIQYPRAFLGIMELAVLEDMPEVQESALLALANLVTADTAPKIFELPKLLAQLVHLAPTCEAALVAMVNLDLYRKKPSISYVSQSAEQSLARCRRLPDLRLLNYCTS